MTRRRFGCWASGVAALVGALVLLLTGCSGGDRITIQSAIDAAEVGGTVVVAVGTYRENLRLTKSLTLIGDESSPGEVELSGREDDTAAIEIVGDADVEATIKGVTIARSDGSGIRVSGDASASLVDVVIENCAGSGLTIRDVSGVLAADCTFADSDRNGITIIGDGRLEAHGCTLKGNAAAGIAAVTEGTIILRDCVVADNGENGFSLGGNSRVLLSNVRIEENGGGPVTGGPSVAPGTAVPTDVGTGLWVEGETEVEMSGCDVTGSERFGIVVSERAAVRLEDCTVSESGRGGIFAITDGGTALLTTAITGNDEFGVFVAGGTHFEMNGCEVSANRGAGIIVYDVKCYGTEVAASPYRHSGPISGANNVIRAPDSSEGESAMDCCPSSLCQILGRKTETEDDAP